jgi:hypothetical protein
LSVVEEIINIKTKALGFELVTWAPGRTCLANTAAFLSIFQYGIALFFIEQDMHNSTASSVRSIVRFAFLHWKNFEQNTHILGF